MTINFYTKDLTTQRPRHVDTYNPGRPNPVLVCFNGVNHYERMTSRELIEKSDKSKQEHQALDTPTTSPLHITVNVVGSGAQVSNCMFSEIKVVGVEYGCAPRGVQDILSILQEKNKEAIKLAITECYVEPCCSKDLSGTNSIPLNTTFKQLLNAKDNSNKKVLVLLGDSGAGKSTAVAYLANGLMGNGAITLFIPMNSNILGPNLDNLIEEYLMSGIGLRREEVDSLKKLTKEKGIIIVFDAYDEKRNHKCFPLYTAEQLIDWNAKVIITCRTQYFYTQQDLKNLFTPVSAVTFKSFEEQLQLLYMVPFIEDQIVYYINKQPKECKDLCLELINKLNLLSILGNPLVLYFFVQGVFQLKAKFDSGLFNARQMYRTDIYESFIEQWFAREENRLTSISGQNTLARVIFTEYSCAIAVKMLQKPAFEIEYNPKKADKDEFSEAQCTHTEEVSIWEVFFKESAEQGKMACPLRRTADNYYTFLHRSIRPKGGERPFCPQMIW